MTTPTPRHMRMYKASPRIVADENGKKVIKKDPVVVDVPVEAAVTDQAMQDLIARQTKERLEMYQKHERDFLEITPKSAPADTTVTQ